MQVPIGWYPHWTSVRSALSWPLALGAIACVTLADSRPDRTAPPPLAAVLSSPLAIGRSTHAIDPHRRPAHLAPPRRPPPARRGRPARRRRQPHRADRPERLGQVDA